MQIQWFPGHMTKTRRMIEENLKLVDAVIELVDARLPLSSRNPEIDKLCFNKPRIVLMNKADLADEQITRLWIEYFKKRSLVVISINSRTGKGMEKIQSSAKELLKEKIERDIKKGIVNRPIKLMVVGIPNVGKSSFINKFAGKASTEVGDRPGVTRSKQWIRLTNGFELLDTPGVLWPKFDDIEVARRLAFTGAIKDEILDIEDLAHYLLEYLRDNYPLLLQERYKIENIAELKGYEITEVIGKKRGFVITGGNVNTERAAIIILDEFRAAKIGRVTLERPEAD